MLRFSNTERSATADRFGISESSFKLYVKGILGESYLAYF